jgi:L-lactate dehydrogenase
MKIGIIGSGAVGATAAYAMVLTGVGREIVLVDVNRARAGAEADDILHAAPFTHPVNVFAGEYEDLKGSQVVMITAGAKQKPGESRLQLLSRNAGILQEIVPGIINHAPEAILLVATNPVDIITHLTARIAAKYNIPSSRVIGSGTTLDTARFRALLGRSLGVDPRHIHGYVVGEHGDSEVLTWSLAAVGGIPLYDFCKMQNLDLYDSKLEEIERDVRQAAYKIIEGKGATNYGIGGALARIVEAILRDQRSIMTVCTLKSEVSGVRDVTVSLPHLIGEEGILSSFPLPLSDFEEEKLNKSARTVRNALDELDKEEVAHGRND